MRLILLPLLALALLTSATARDAEAPERLTSETLGGSPRALVHVSTDKPVYRTGETLYARGIVLEAGTHRPHLSGEWMQAEVLGPRGETVFGTGSDTEGGVAAFSWRIPEGQPGGLYTLRMAGSGAPGERTFEIRAFRAPRIKTQIVFLRDGYAPGDEVVATLSATRAEGGAPAGARVTLVAVVDGTEVARQPAGTVDSRGVARATFRLPESIERGEGTLALVIEDGGVVETASKSIPILVRSVDLSLQPEGGELVAGLPARVYLEARLPSGKPADVAGEIVTAAGKAVATFRTEHEGRARVRLTPVAGERYRVRITEPAGIASSPALPDVIDDGGLVSSVEDVTEARKALRLRAGASRAGEYELTVSSREREIATQRVKLAAGELRPVSIALDDEVDGVLRVTLWDDEGRPLSERLVFRRPADEVKVSIETDRPRRVPGETVELRIRTTRPDGSPVAATVGVAVSDDSVRELLETREQPPSLPVQVFLENDVRELADAAVYLDPSNPAAPRAVDLLLGTQGWRRFAFVTDVAAFVKEHGDDALRALATRRPPEPPQEVAWEEESDGAVLGAVKELRKKVALADAPPEPMLMLPAPPAAAVPGESRDDGAAAGIVAAIGRDAEWKAGGRAAANEAAARAAGEAQQRARAMKDERVRFEAEAEPLRRQAPVIVRVHAHRVRANRTPGERMDFTDTVYWNAGLRTSASGEAVVSFDLSDSVTSFRVSCDAFTETGVLGAGSSLVESVEPFYLEAKMPLEIACGDVVRVPVTAVNGTPGDLDGVRISATASGGLFAGTLPAVDVGEGDRIRSLLTVKAGAPGTAELNVAGTAGAHADAVTRPVTIVPLGFPVSRSFSGLLAPGGSVTHELVVPADAVAGSLRADIKLFPTSLGKLTGALERLIQEPSGCFEQTSSTTYPLVMAAQYFETHQGVDPSLITRSREMLAKGHERLIGFETKTKGYEWFGEAPGHEALSAFGLMEFTDMSRVREVDPAMLARTREWILAARDGKGGFRRERRALHTWIEDEDCSNGYILWALLNAGEPSAGLSKEIDALQRAAQASTNSYVHALAAGVLQQSGRKDAAATLRERLASRQAADGSIEGGTTTIVGSTGEALLIETTALAALAFLESPEHQAQAGKAMRFLSESCEGGRYGSTQSTVLALRAIVAHDALRSRPRAAGAVTLTIDGKPAGEVEFDETTESAIVLPDPAALLGPGRHRIALVMRDGSEMPYAVEVSLKRESPESSPDCPLGLSVSLSATSFREGDAGEATLRLTSRSAEPLPMAVAIVGLPGGCEPRHDQLKELVKGGRIAAYEVRGREVVLYFRSVKAHADERIPVSFIAAVPGTYSGPASRAYLYYGDEDKTWAPGMRVEIEAL